MKKFYILLAILLSNAAIYAQIPNPSFETWSGGEPTGCVALEGPKSIIQSTNHYGSGNYAAELVPQVVLGYTVAPSLATVNTDETSD